MEVNPAVLLDCVRRALAEDLGGHDRGAEADITGRIALPGSRRGMARMVAKSDGILAGIACATAAFTALDPSARCGSHKLDGDRFTRGDLVMTVEADTRALLAAERTALNFVQRLSGVATLTRAFVDAVAGTRAEILDTRKTTPGLRALEKAAVLAGGGKNHRFGLHDQVLLKENHFGFALPVSYEDVVRKCVLEQDRPVVAEARTVAEALAAVRGGAAVVLLDNFRPGPELRDAVGAVRQAARELGSHVLTEASGGVGLASVRSFAETGVDRISIGALTHSAPSADLSLLVEGVE